MPSNITSSMPAPHPMLHHATTSSTSPLYNWVSTGPAKPLVGLKHPPHPQYVTSYWMKHPLSTHTK